MMDHADSSLAGIRLPDLVPPPLAADSSRGWLLTRDYGQSLRHAFGEDRRRAILHRVLADYARMQIAWGNQRLPTCCCTARCGSATSCVR
jgi:hypothetical protein